MALVMPRSAQADTLSLIVSEEELELRLYQNDVAPSDGRQFERSFKISIKQL